MERSTLDLRLSIFEGDNARVSNLMLFGHLRADTDNPPRSTAEFLLLCRDESGSPPPWITKSALTDQDVARLAGLLCAAGFPAAGTRIVPNKCPLANVMRIALDVRLHGGDRSLNFHSELAGFSGGDAEPVLAVLRRLGELAEVGGRPAVRAVLDRLLLDRRPHADRQRPRGRLDLRGRSAWSGLAADTAEGLPFGAGSPGNARDTASRLSWTLPTDL